MCKLVRVCFCRVTKKKQENHQIITTTTRKKRYQNGHFTHIEFFYEFSFCDVGTWIYGHARKLVLVTWKFTEFGLKCSRPDENYFPQWWIKCVPIRFYYLQIVEITRSENIGSRCNELCAMSVRLFDFTYVEKEANNAKSCALHKNPIEIEFMRT